MRPRNNAHRVVIKRLLKPRSTEKCSSLEPGSFFYPSKWPEAAPQRPQPCLFATFIRQKLKWIRSNLHYFDSTQLPDRQFYTGISSVLGFAYTRTPSRYTAYLPRLETCLKPQFSKMSPALEPQALFDPTNCSGTAREKRLSRAILVQ